MDKEEGVLGDLKVTSSYKLMKVLGIYKVDVPTGAVYKTGLKKGQPKTRKDFRYNGVRQVYGWAIQLNAYRMLLESQGFTVNRMVIYTLCRDSGLRITAERGSRSSIYLIPIQRISDRWLQRYLSTKARRLKIALNNKQLSPICTAREWWQDRKCLDYCVVADSCPYAE